MKIKKREHQGYSICNEDLIRARILLAEIRAEMYDYLFKNNLGKNGKQEM